MRCWVNNQKKVESTVKEENVFAQSRVACVALWKRRGVTAVCSVFVQITELGTEFLYRCFTFSSSLNITLFPIKAVGCLMAFSVVSQA